MRRKRLLAATEVCLPMMLLALAAIFFELFLWTMHSGRPMPSWAFFALGMICVCAHFCIPRRRPRPPRIHDPQYQRRKSALLKCKNADEH